MKDQDVWEEKWRGYGFLEMLGDMRQVFPKQRVMQMFAWMALIGAVAGESRDITVRRLTRAGFGKSSVYSAISDIAQFQAYLKAKWGVEVSREDLAEKSRQAQAEVSQLAEPVV